MSDPTPYNITTLFSKINWSHLPVQNIEVLTSWYGVSDGLESLFQFPSWKSCKTVYV